MKTSNACEKFRNVFLGRAPCAAGPEMTFGSPIKRVDDTGGNRRSNKTSPSFKFQVRGI